MRSPRIGGAGFGTGATSTMEDERKNIVQIV
jgi:hypothetical protein